MAAESARLEGRSGAQSPSSVGLARASSGGADTAAGYIHPAWLLPTANNISP